MIEKTKKHIALIGTSANAAIQFRSNLIQCLIEQGHDVCVLCHDFDDKSRAVIETLGAKTIDNPIGRSNTNPAKDLFATYRLSKILKSQSVDIVLSYFIKPVVFGNLAAWIARVENRFAMIEGLGWAFSLTPPGEKKGARILRFLQIMLMRIVLPFSKAVIFLNDDDLKRLRDEQKIPMQKTHILGGIGAPAEFFENLPIPKKPIRFIFVARLLFDKGIREFIAAAKIVKMRYPGVSFDVYGTIDPDNPRSLTQADIEHYEREDFMTFHGYQTDMFRIYKEASCLILPSSYGEGLPRTVQEVMAMSRPAIVCDTPGARQAVIHGETGYIIPPFDKEALVNKIETLIQNPKTLDIMGQNAHAYAKVHYDGKIQAQKLASLILEES